MDRFCAKCGSKLDGMTGMCPNCNNGNDNKNKKLIVLLVLAIICAIAVISVFAAVVITDISAKDKEEETQPDTTAVTEQVTEEKQEKEEEEKADDKDDDESEKKGSVKYNDTSSKNTDSAPKKNSTPKKPESYRDKFINALIADQSAWNTPMFGDGSSMTTCVYFIDIDFDGNLELISEYSMGSGGTVVEVYGYKNDRIVHYNIDKEAVLINVFNYYYDADDSTYRIFGTDTTTFCFDSSQSHKDQSNYELVVIDDTIYKDFYTSYCPLRGYYRLDRKGDVTLGYIEGSYNYNIIDFGNDSSQYDRVNDARLENCEKLKVYKGIVESSQWRSYSDSEKKTALEKSYDSFSYN